MKSGLMKKWWIRGSSWDILHFSHPQRWWKSDEQVMKKWWNLVWWKSDEKVMKSGLMKKWWIRGFSWDILHFSHPQRWWKSDEKVMKKWWNLVWWKSDEKVMKKWWNLVWWKSDEFEVSAETFSTFRILKGDEKVMKKWWVLVCKAKFFPNSFQILSNSFQFFPILSLSGLPRAHLSGSTVKKQPNQYITEAAGGEG